MNDTDLIRQVLLRRGFKVGETDVETLQQATPEQAAGHEPRITSVDCLAGR
jgi:hypothetical protein